MHRSSLLRSAASALALSALAASAAGQACPTGSSELLVQLPDYQNGFTSDLGCEGCGGDGQGCAEALVLPAPTTITEVRIWGIFQGGDTPTNDFTVRVHAHDPGTGLPVQPPAPVWSESGIPAVITPTGVNTPPPLVPALEYLVAMTPSTPLDLPAGTWWLEIWCDSGTGTDDFGWLTGTTDPSAGLPAAAIATQCPATAFFPLNLDMAMSVCGVPGAGPVSVYCAGDGSAASCPCGNAGGAGAGCANSTGAGATLGSSGSPSVSADDLSFAAANLLPAQPALLFLGENAVANGDGLPFGDGLRCAGLNVVRLGVQAPDGAGAAAWGPGLAGLGGYGAGDVRFFQAWYRDPVGGPCGSGFNLTGGVQVLFAP